MPRPYAPPPISPLPAAEPFSMDDRKKADLARALTLPSLPPALCDKISQAIGCYRMTAAGSGDTTVANVLVALNELSKSGRAYDKAINRLADDRSGVDYTTHEMLQPLAKAVLRDEPGSRDSLVQAATKRAEELGTHKRIAPQTESLRFFCGVLRLIFNQSGSPALQEGLDRSWHQCRTFAMEVFTIADIEHADFDAHPERLSEYLGTDVTFG